ncbi:discoidin domain-containing protein [Streptomyces sp. NPDC050658]|uniref:discoidin domain-containing protein n=1 Tax=unclassified Streptomyces TaxID=2593676 RepID=UPI00342B7927
MARTSPLPDDEPCPGCESPVHRTDIFCGACGTYLGWDDAQPSVHVPEPRFTPDAPEPRFSHDAEETLRLGIIEADVATPMACPGRGCRYPNPRVRTFCTRCGTLLRPLLPPPPRPWWARITEEVRDALHRRPQVWHRDHRKYAPVAVAAAVLALALTGAGQPLTGPLRQGIALAHDRFASKAMVVASSVSASSQQSGFPARCAADGVDNRAWAPEASGDQARRQWWQADFGHPFRLTTLVVFGGVSPQPREYLAAGRPQKLRAVAITAGKRAFVKELDLADQPGPQTFSWGVDDVQAVRLQIVGVRSAGGKGAKSAKAPVGIAEVQFFTRRSEV